MFTIQDTRKVEAPYFVFKEDGVACELTVFLENRPGSFAALGEALGNAGINIEGICGFICGEKNLMHVVVKNTGGARFALENAGIAVQSERDVVILAIANQPGEFGRACRQLAVAGVNINLAYVTLQGQLVLGVEDFNRACIVLGISRDR